MINKATGMDRSLLLWWSPMKSVKDRVLGRS